MTVKTRIQTQPDAYFELVKQFPLTHIRDKAHLKEATAVVHRLLQENLDEGQEEYLDALTDLIDIYEAKHVVIPDASGADVLRVLIASSGLSQTALAKKVKISQSTLSAVLSGKRMLKPTHMASLAAFFKVSPAVFLPG